jgi:hypothetical protein
MLLEDSSSYMGDIIDLGKGLEKIGNNVCTEIKI